MTEEESRLIEWRDSKKEVYICLSESDKPLTVEDISSQIEYASRTVYRALRSLGYADVVERFRRDIPNSPYRYSLKDEVGGE